LGKKLYVVSLNRLFCHRSYAEFEAQLQAWGARPLLDGEWGLRSALPALALKEQLRKLVDRQDRILVIEVSGEWASRHAL